jgi:predicted metal-dependent hydrolase
VTVVASDIATRKVAFTYPTDLDPVWNQRLPEFAIAANSISLLMPHVEPYVIKAIKSASDQLSGELALDAEAFCAQEAQHHKQHQKFNRILAQHYRGLNRLDRWMKRTYEWFWRSRSQGFSLAFAAGAETVAYTLARWTESRMGKLFSGAEPTMSTLFLWHLAEEVEHKSVAYDVYKTVDGRRWLLAVAMFWAGLITGVFGVMGSLYMLKAERRLFKPGTYLRMLPWTVSFIFDLLPAMAVASLSNKHHPNDLTDPQWFALFLQGYDPDSGTIELVEI